MGTIYVGGRFKSTSGLTNLHKTNDLLDDRIERLESILDGFDVYKTVNWSVLEDVYEFVDLGLPSGTLWATCNVGATKPEEYGLYFAWGETEGYTRITNTKEFSWSDYAHGTSESNLTKYNSTDGLITLELTDDAARVNMGGNWRMPTKAECQELLDNTARSWTTVNGVYGMKFTSNSDTSKSIFIPAAGDCHDGFLFHTGSYGSLWSSSLNSSSVAQAYGLYFSYSYADVGKDKRRSGYSIRPVKSKS